MTRLLSWLGHCLAGLALACVAAGSSAPALAQSNASFSHGVAFNGSQATLWFKSNVATTWVDAHYQLNGGAQQNLRMPYNSATARYEQPLAGAVNGTRVDYWFTYNNGNPAYDSARFSATVSTGGGTDPGTPQNPGTPGNGADWNARTTFKVENATNGRWSDAQVYWAVIGKSWQTGEFVHVDAAGNVVPMRLSDNTVPKNGRLYANYFFPLSQTRQITIPPINSARVLMSVGSPMYIEVNTDGAGRVAYAGANIENATDPNLDVVFDFGEFALIPKGQPDQGIFINTTRVDHFGFPLKLRLQGLGGYDKTVGEPLTESRDTLFTRFQQEVPVEFRSLAEPNFPAVPPRTRILAPAHFTFRPGDVNGAYLDGYIGEMWNRFKSQDLVFTLENLGTFRGRVDASTNRFVFTGGRFNGTYYINGQPNTAEVFLGAGKLDDPRKPDGSFQVDVPNGDPAKSIQLQIQAQVCAALNRHVLANPADWYRPAAFYPAGTRANWFAKFWHDHAIKGTEGNANGVGLAYGFAYDDVGGFSPSLHTNAPTTVTYTIGW
ncbi:glycoside hydrolase family 64 protein [Roseateles sp. So40a]|uniref:glycoside hydrolase family 64 protein n=1 Tax=Roseateles sp. So40a TaxID=3400226 RepID=UPI003A858076